MTAQPGDGAAVILHVIEAARAWNAECGLQGPKRARPDLDVENSLAEWVDRLEAWLEREAPAASVSAGWEARTWGELVEGDTVSVGGVEAVVESAQVQVWHVDPRSSEYRPQPMEHSVTKVRLAGREPLYSMPTGGEVETLRGPAGQAIDEVNGRHAGMVAADRILILASWASDAFQTLQATGLNPEPIAMSPDGIC